MAWELVQVAFPDGAVKLFRSVRHRDRRGWLVEVFRTDELHSWGLPPTFVQQNHSYSRRGVIRGLHFQHSPPMGKLLRVTRGRAFVVEVDVRKSSPSCGRYFSIELSAREPMQLWIPPGFANGFCALTRGVEVEYLCTAPYNPAGEIVLRWDDPELGIPWPVTTPVLSERDRSGIMLQQWLRHPAAESLGQW
ncbi:MAG: dTDP-4-dehydrorhamnose 3,5-epimerase [Bacteroidota bacterium]|nr:dTDP-4-dehydrorhamnose 3,5-epimerase [Bacteroidota bacterium]